MENIKDKMISVLMSMSLLITPMVETIGSYAIDEDVEPPVPIEDECIISGTLSECAYDNYKDKKSPQILSDTEIKIQLKERVETLTTDQDGKFSYSIPEEDQIEPEEKEDQKEAKEDEPITYKWSVSATKDYLSAIGNLEPGKDASLYVQDRYEAKSTDYKASDSENFINGFARGKGTYEILPTGSNKLTDKLDGEEKSSLMLDVDEDGLISPFYIVKDGKCSKIIDKAILAIDNIAPEVTSITTEAAGLFTRIKSHGIYSKEKAELKVVASIKEEGSGLEKVYIVGKNAEGDVEYDATAIKSENDAYSVTIAVPDKDTILDAEVLYLVAIDKFGNKSNEALLKQSKDASDDTAKVTIEAIAPELNLEIIGAKNTYGWYKNVPQIQLKATDTLSGLENMKSILCYPEDEFGDVSIDNKDFATKTIEESAMISTIKDFSMSEDGSVVIKACATDNCDNTAEVEETIKVDTNAPTLFISGIENGTYVNKIPSITINENEDYPAEENNKIFVSISKNSKEIFSGSAEKKNTVMLGTSLISADGHYTIRANAHDAADNPATEVIKSYIYDSKAPEISISGVKAGKFYNKPQTLKISVNEANYSSNEVVIKATKKVGGKITPISIPWANKGELSSVSKTFNDTGTYTIEVSARDKAGNVANKKTISFSVDTNPPVIKISGITDRKVYTYNDALNPKIDISDDFLASKNIVYTKAGQKINKISFSKDKANDGIYTVQVSATDKAGNTTKVDLMFTINRFGSFYKYNDAIKKINGKSVQAVDSDLVITEYNVSKLVNTEGKVKLDLKDLNKNSESKELPMSKDGYYVTTHRFGSDLFLDEGVYEINVASRDAAGNSMNSSEENGIIKFTVDCTEPSLTISGIEGNTVKGTSADLILDVSDNIDKDLYEDVSILVNGEERALKKGNDGKHYFTLQEGMDQSVEINVCDSAGNEATYSESISVTENMLAFIFAKHKLFVVLGGIFVLALIAFGIASMSNKKKKQAEEAMK